MALTTEKSSTAYDFTYFLFDGRIKDSFINKPFEIKGFYGVITDIVKFKYAQG